eukprot:TRINITY_DN6162_c0_g2_i1.p1 TRINITY_DN6162_c0_g2~~TRINITY_DN6162_c0_g2_i1.p1  ORF type:complete len:151 (+),score=24.36 TRINITY_DN6162_c0_g2_i1:151-603(+)
MSDLTKEKFCLVVGVNPVGSRVAWRFAEEGYGIGLITRQEETGLALNSELSVAGHISDFVVADVGHEANYGAFERLKVKFGIPSILVYTPHDHVRASLTDSSARHVHSSLRSTGTGAYYVSQFAAQEMTKRGQGTVVYVGNNLAKQGFGW